MTTTTGEQTPPATTTVTAAPPSHLDPAPTVVSVTVGNSPASSGVSEGAPTERETAGEDSSLHPDATTVRDRTRQALRAVRAYLTPPSVLTDPPPSWAELAAYARYGAWTSRADGPLRRLGVAWYVAVGLSVTAACRYIEWIFQRPGRAIPVFVLWKLLISTGPGPWAADHLIRPVLGLLAWVLL
ncbi:hypothetical protein ACNTMW_31035 [Planosporangium sp. 12N6]|uniref:hypothetical protein n=1 Tax=Planosporangium spinosum TaxID=3402278 RepID=UPI003CE9BACE